MNWKALYVTSRSEKKVVERLSDLGITAYVPLKKERRQWSDRKKTVITPLINGYVFVQVSPAEREIVFKAAGVIQYVRYNGGDAIIREEEIEVLKRIEQKGYDAEASPEIHFASGEKTTIAHGPFKGLHGIVERYAGKDIYTINLESIGFSVKINLPSEVLTKK